MFAKLLSDPYFWTTLSLLGFFLVLIKVGVPGKIATALDNRATRIKAELEEARRLREEAQALLAQIERKARATEEEAEKIIAQAKIDAEAAAAQAKAALARSIERRIKAAEDQIKLAQDAAVRQVRDQAVNVAVAAAQDVIANTMTAKDGADLIDGAIAEVARRLN